MLLFFKTFETLIVLFHQSVSFKQFSEQNFLVGFYHL